MHAIRPMSDLRNHTSEILELVHTENQPVFITRNGYGDLVVMSLAHYDQLLSQLQLYQKLGEAEALDAAGEEGITHEEMMAALRAEV
ncbi:MAG: type II toxin-antitoxin system prevent-host-death family antitoxin [Chloroflexota bacterium]